MISNFPFRQRSQTLLSNASGLLHALRLVSHGFFALYNNYALRKYTREPETKKKVQLSQTILEFSLKKKGSNCFVYFTSKRIWNKSFKKCIVKHFLLTLYSTQPVICFIFTLIWDESLIPICRKRQTDTHIALEDAVILLQHSSNLRILCAVTHSKEKSAISVMSRAANSFPNS